MLAYVGLALADVVPGGWRLRTLVVSQAELSARVRAAHRAERLAAFGAEPRTSGGVLFIGSSTIERFDLARHYPLAKGVNRGIGDEDLAGLGARAVKTVRQVQPEAIVLYAASVDFRRHLTPPGQIVRGVESLLAELREASPGVPMGLIEILPERVMDETMAERLEATNRALAELVVRTPDVDWIRTSRAPVVDPETGRLSPEHSADRLHLNDAGYRELRDWLVADAPSIGALLTR